MSRIEEGTLLWQPDEETMRTANITRFMEWLAQEQDRPFTSYDELWHWSVWDLEGFWEAFWKWAGIYSVTPYRKVLASPNMPGAQWFDGVQINYVQAVFRNSRADAPAIMYRREGGVTGELSWAELLSQVGAVRQSLKNLGVERGDRVAAFVPNIPEAVVAFLATVSLGAIWSSCSPDFGGPSVVNRFRQIDPKVLIAVDGYRYNGKDYRKLDVVENVAKSLPSLGATVVIRYLDPNGVPPSFSGISLWEDLLRTPGEVTWDPVPFDHPLWILFSSGTTGHPKAIVQSHGGILLEHLKVTRLHMNLSPEDRFFWYTTTGWMMWNILMAGLLVGATILLYDGSTSYPDLSVLWEWCQETGMTVFGTSAAFLHACMKAGLKPRERFDLSRLKAIGSTASPLTPEGFEWVYESVKPGVWLASSSGGTDVCTAFVGGLPTLAVRAGEIQCRCLGVKAEAYDPQGRPVVGEVGELVISEPMPSMPIYFWNDPDGTRYRESYFTTFPGVWLHGDWIKLNPNGSCAIYGRSDSTINRYGVRMGSSEIYQAVEAMDAVQDSLVVDVAHGGEMVMCLFVVLQKDLTLNDKLIASIRQNIRKDLSPRHVPDLIVAVPEIPKTLNGKKMEVPVRRILAGRALEDVVNVDAMTNPESLGPFVQFAETLKTLR